MPTTKRDPDGGAAQGNRRVMVYVAPDLHRAIEHLATDEDRSTSSVYVEAARAFLEARGRQVDADPVPIATPPTATPPELAAAIERQGERIEELQAAVAGIRGGRLHNGQAPAGTTVAEAMKVVLGIVKAAGPAGIASRELGTAIQASHVNPGAAETAKAVLRAAGFVRCEGKRWYVDGG